MKQEEFVVKILEVLSPMPDVIAINYYRLKPVVWSTLAKRIKSVNAKTQIF